jgi:uncharacterized surface protein with fasciclin (FAS1) repeats
VVTPNIQAGTSIIHVINGVLLPPQSVITKALAGTTVSG